MSKLSRVILLCAATIFSWLFFSQTASATTIGITGDKFMLNSQAQFLVFASYFDGMRAQNLSGDLDFLKSGGVNGIRVFAIGFPDGSVIFDGNGVVDTSSLNQLKAVVDAANSRNMVVDVTFARVVDTTSVSNYKKGVEATIKQFKNNSNLLFDLQNERNGDSRVFLSEQDTIELRNNIKNRVGQNLLLSASMAYGVTPQEAVNFANQGMDFINFHDGRESDWYSQTADRVGQLKSGGKPSYFGEPNRCYQSPCEWSADNFISAVTGAKGAGGGAWTFHSRASYDLRNSSLKSNYSAAEIDFLDKFKTKLNAIPWGSSSVTPLEPISPPTITSFSPINVVPDMDIEIIGTNLSGTITLTDSAGKFISITGLSNNTLTTYDFALSPDVVSGEYILSIENSKGKATATEKLIVTAGGSPFSPRTIPGIPEGYMGLDQLLIFFLTWSKYLLGIAIFVMIFFGGVKWFFSQGNPSQITEAQGIIKNAVIGAILLLSAYLILYTVNPDLINGSFTLPGVQSVPGTGTTVTSTTSSSCTNLQVVAGQNNEPYPRKNALEVDRLIADIRTKLPGANIGTIFTYDNDHEYCNYTRGGKQCGACSHAVNSCHYGGRTGKDGALAIDFTVVGSIGDKIIGAAMASGAKDARCENSGGIRVTCSDTSATHVHVTSKSCDVN